MSLNIPSSPNEIYERMRSDSQAIVPSLNPGLRASLHKSLLIAFSGSSFEQFLTLQVLINEIFIDTATRDFLERWGSYKSITRNPATQSEGAIKAAGTPGTFIPTGTLYSSPDGQQYQTLSDATVAANSISVTLLNNSVFEAFATTASAHGYVTGQQVVISGASPSFFNGTKTITVTGDTTFKYSITPTLPFTASGTILSTENVANLNVQSLETGINTNQLSGVALTIDTPIAGLNDTAIVSEGEIGGGSDIENDDNLRTRILEAYQRPIALFNVAQIQSQAKLVTGVTRVFVQEITPNIGQVTIYFTRDNDPSIIPSLSEVEAVKESILLIKPAYIRDEDVIVEAPEPVPTNFTFSSITPNTPNMQQAIIDNLDTFFRTQTVVGENVEETDYICAINNTIDTNTGAKLETFTLSAPIGDISILNNQIGTLGVVNF